LGDIGRDGKIISTGPGVWISDYMLAILIVGFCGFPQYLQVKGQIGQDLFISPPQFITCILSAMFSLLSSFGQYIPYVCLQLITSDPSDRFSQTLVWPPWH
jgi:hypothetical protein